MTFDPTKPVTTRDGRKAEIVPCEGFRGRDEGETILYRTWEPEGGQIVDACHADGRYSHCNNAGEDSDLINIPEEPVTIKAYAVMKRGGLAGLYGKRSAAEENIRGHQGYSIVPLTGTFTPGEGME